VPRVRRSERTGFGCSRDYRGVKGLESELGEELWVPTRELEKKRAGMTDRPEKSPGKKGNWIRCLGR